jgi:hypothetical protein
MKTANVTIPPGYGLEHIPFGKLYANQEECEAAAGQLAAELKELFGRYGIHGVLATGMMLCVDAEGVQTLFGFSHADGCTACTATALANTGLTVAGAAPVVMAAGELIGQAAKIREDELRREQAARSLDTLDVKGPTQ